MVDDTNYLIRSFFEDDILSAELCPLSTFDELEDKYVIQIDLPLVKKENIQAELKNDNTLLIKARLDKSLQTLSLGGVTNFDCFKKTFFIPSTSEIDRENVQAVFRDGILSVTIPKKQKGSRISVE